MLLTQFDPERYAVINPNMVHQPVPDFPETVVSIFSHTLFNAILSLLGGKPISQVKDVDGHHPIYEVIYNGRRFAFCKARLGAPACVGSFEDIIPMGAKRIILTGTCGVLDKSISDCGIIVPTHAIRDEGTSYHYAPAADYIEVNRKYRDTFLSVLQEHGYSYTMGTTWTTDAFYRETPKKVAERKKMGAVCVEMECASMQAMCDFRGVEFFQFFYAADNLDGNVWDPRSLSGSTRLNDKEKIALLAFELASKIENGGIIMNALIDISTVTLKTERLLLRPWRETDLEDFYEYAKVDGVGQMAGWLPHESIEVSKKILGGFIAEKKTFALEYQGKIIGSLGLENYPEEKFPQLSYLRGRSIGYVLSKDYWGQGLMPEAVGAVIDYAFKELRLDFLVVGHFVRNSQSRRVIEKCGFTYMSDGTYETRYGTTENVRDYILKRSF